MTRLHLLFRNLWHFRGVNLAVIAGMAVATAVLTGALMVGDSVRGSLADLALRRLGPVDDALISTRFFDSSLAERLGGGVVPAIVIRGGASNESAAGQGTARTADVQIAALGAALPGVANLPASRGTCIVNGELAQDLTISAGGATVVLSVPTGGDSPRESALARRGRNDVLNELRATASKIDAGEDFVSLFNPNPSQRTPRNAWVNLQDLQDTIDQAGRVNVLLAHDAPGASDDAAVNALNDKIRKVVRLDDYGLSLIPVGDEEASVFARQTYISPPAVAAAQRAAEALYVRLRKVSVNLINSLTDASSGKTVHYAVGAGISSLDQGPLKENEIAINQWTADQLGAKVGDSLKIDFYLRQPGGDLSDASKALPPGQLTFTVKYVLPMSGLGADPKLPPNYKGLTDADSVADWDPPEGLKIDKKLVTPADEAYWKQYRAAPKLFVNFETARKLWGGVFGDVTGLRVPAGDSEKFAARFLAEINPQSMGLVFRPIKAQQLAAASGGTDFGMFFLMFSFFLIVAAALLVAMLFRLNVEQRARQLGLMSAVGYRPGALRKMALAEGMILAIVGGLIGLAAAVGYTALILLGLRTWWIGAVGTTAMTLHIDPLTLLYGWVGSLAVAFCAILWAVWRIGRTRPAWLLAGGWGSEIRKRGDGRWLRWSAIVAIVIGAAIVVSALVTRNVTPEAGFGGGALLLCGALTWLAGALRPRRHAGASFVGAASIVRFGVGNAAQNPARGVLCIGLIAFAAFTLITVAAVKQEGASDSGGKNSETGGYRLILSAAIPLTGDLNTVAGRRLLGIREPNDPVFAGVHFTNLRQWSGQDISCLNLTKPNSPTILGLPPEMIARGGFIAGDALTPTANFWTLLDSDQGDQIPVIADSDTQEYVLQIPLGGTMPITDQLGNQRQLKLVATVAHSIFQGQLLMGDGNFRKLFPAQSGFGTVLIDMPGVPAAEIPEREKNLSRTLSSELADFSTSVDTTDARLRTYQNVQNTYLETFQTLGALGLMLGTLGLAVVLIRTVIERRGELALLASLGFTFGAREKLVFSENAFLLILGLLLGAISAVLGILPAVFREARPINVANLGATLAIVLAIGLASAIVAVRLSGLHFKPADLRRE